MKKLLTFLVIVANLCLLCSCSLTPETEKAEIEYVDIVQFLQEKGIYDITVTPDPNLSSHIDIEGQISEEYSFYLSSRYHNKNNMCDNTAIVYCGNEQDGGDGGRASLTSIDRNNPLTWNALFTLDDEGLAKLKKRGVNKVFYDNNLKAYLLDFQIVGLDYFLQGGEIYGLEDSIDYYNGPHYFFNSAVWAKDNYLISKGDVVAYPQIEAGERPISSKELIPWSEYKSRHPESLNFQQ